MACFSVWVVWKCHVIGVSHLEVLTSIGVRAGWLFLGFCFYIPDASEWMAIKKKKRRSKCVIRQMRS